MASNLRRSQRTFSQRFLTTENRVNQVRRRPAPRRIGSRVIVGENISPSAVDFPELSVAVNSFIQATADGKNSIYRQGTAPVGGTYVVGDLWFDTANDNKLWRWELVAGVGQWVSFGLGNAAISNLDVGKLTAGTISVLVTLTGSLVAGTGSSTLTVNSTGMYFGSSNYATAPFRVSADGQLYVGTSPNWLRVDSTGKVWTGGATFTDAEFRVDTDGSVRIGPRLTYSITAVSPNTPTFSATYTTSTTHSLEVGDAVTITGISPADYNGTYTVTAVTTNTFRVTNISTAAVTTATGSVTTTALFINNSGGITIGTAEGTGQFIVSPTGQVDIGGDDVTSFHISPEGNIWAGAQSNGFATAPFKLTNDGSIDVGGDDSTSLHISSLGDVYVGTPKNATPFAASAVGFSTITGLSTSTITISTGATPHEYQIGDRVTLTGVTTVPPNAFTVSDYTVLSTPTTTTYTIQNPAYRDITAVSPSTPAVGSVQYTVSALTPHRYRIGQAVTIAGLAPAGYNGTFRITQINSANTFVVTNATTTAVTTPTGTAIGRSFLQTITTVAPSTPAFGTVRYTTDVSHGFITGQSVTISGITPAGYSGTFTIANVASSTTFDIANATTGAATLTSAIADGGALYYVAGTGQARRIPPFNLTASTGAVRASIVVSSDRVAGSAAHLNLNNVLNLTTGVAIGPNTIYGTSSYSSYDEAFNFRLNAAEGFLGRIDTADVISIGANLTHGLGYWSNLPVVVENGVYGNDFTRRTSTTVLQTATGITAVWTNATNGGLLGKLSSSRRYKENIIEISDEDLDPLNLLNIPVVQFKFRDGVLLESDSRVGLTLPGFIAEDVNDAYPIAAEKGEDGAIESWNANFIVPPMLKLIQDLYARVQALESR